MQWVRSGLITPLARLRCSPPISSLTNLHRFALPTASLQRCYRSTVDRGARVPFRPPSREKKTAAFSWTFSRSFAFSVRRGTLSVRRGTTTTTTTTPTTTTRSFRRFFATKKASSKSEWKGSPESTFKSWEELSQEQQNAAETMGYTSEAWEAQRSGSQDTPVPEAMCLPWRTLKPEQQQAATALGFDEGVWASLGELPPGAPLYSSGKFQKWGVLGGRQHWEMLGWTLQSWDKGAEPPQTANTSWSGLSEQEKEAATALGYTPSAWDNDDGSEKIPIEPNTNKGAVLVFPTKAFIMCKQKTWYQMSNYERHAWGVLGWAETSWDEGVDKPATSDYDWTDLSKEQQEAAEALGYDEYLWNHDTDDEVSTSNSWERPLYEQTKDMQWNRMPPHARKQWSILGWTGPKWAGEESAPSTAELEWTSLTSEQQNAARELGYNWFIWDADDGDDDSGISVFAAAGFIVFIAFCFFGIDDGSKNKKTYWKETERKKGTECGDLWREEVSERERWEEKCEQLGFDFHSSEGLNWEYGGRDPYWTENGMYVITQAAKDTLDLATWKLHNLSLLAVDRVINSEELMDKFEIPHDLREAMRVSWSQRQPDLIGRFDLMFNGFDPPKLLEYNADTPTLTLESGVVQKQWLTDRQGRSMFFKKCTQFNTLHESLIDAWKKVFAANNSSDVQTIAIAAQKASVEEKATAIYLAKTAAKALATKVDAVELDVLTFEKLKVKDENGTFLDVLWKLYPYEWLIHEELGASISGDKTDPNATLWLEPPWKLILSNKALLPLLWEMFPEHPNLLPSFWDMASAERYQRDTQKSRLQQPFNPDEFGWVAKPKFGREGMGVRYSFGADSLEGFERLAKDDLEQLAVDPSNPIGYSSDALKAMEEVGKRALGNQVNKQFGGGEPGFGSTVGDQRKRETEITEVPKASDCPFPPLGNPVFQSYFDPPCLMGRRSVVGSWVVHGQPAGVCFREDIEQTTNNNSGFVPHVVVPSPKSISVTAQAHADINTMVNGVYHPIGRKLGHEVYERQKQKANDPPFYLTRSLDGARQRWMIANDIEGGLDGTTGVCIDDSSDWDSSIGRNFGYATDARRKWKYYNTILGCFSPMIMEIKSTSGTKDRQAHMFGDSGVVPTDLRPLSSSEATLRNALYRETNSSSSSHGHGHGGYGTGRFNSNNNTGSSYRSNRHSTYRSWQRSSSRTSSSRTSGSHSTGSHGRRMGGSYGTHAAS